MARIKAYVRNWWRQWVVDDFDRHYPNEPWLF
jgi:hypothetical protein